MAGEIRLNNFRFSIYIDPDGTVTLTDLPPELREVAEALDPSQQWGASGPSHPGKLSRRRTGNAQTPQPRVNESMGQ